MMGQDFGNSDWTLKPPGFKPSRAGLLTRRELAERFCVSPETTFKWERSGMPCALSDGPGKPSYFSESDVRAWMSKRAEQAGAGSNGGLDPREQKELWQARLAEQQYQLRAGELVRAADMSKLWDAEIVAVRAIILNSYTAAADRVFRAGVVDGVAGVESALKELAYEVLRELADEDRPLQVEAPTLQVRAKPTPATIGRDAFIHNQEPQA
jgi:phage terminase Nu1 subunit (DNA packaging protein)